jgi:hypothetical protein
MTIVALTCFLVVGAAVTSILGRDSVPAARLEMASQLVRIPASNKESKKDRLAVAALALAAFEPPQQTASLSEPLRQAYASAGPDDIEAPKIAVPVAMAPAPLAPPKPKVANKPPPQKSYALLSDMQIASIKQRLRLSSDQEYYWPAVERALRAVARKIHATRKADPNAAGTPPIAGGGTKQRIPASGAKQTTPRPVGFSIPSMILFGGTRAQNGTDIFQRPSINTS